MRFLVLFILTIFYSVPGWSAGHPSWFPDTACKEKWRALIPQNKHIFNATRDGQYLNYAAKVKRSECYKDWALLVYMEAENDLSPYALLDLYEMEAGYQSGDRRAGSTLKTDVVVEADTAGNTGIRRYHMFQSKKVYNDDITKEEILRWTPAHVESPVITLINEAQEKRTHTTAARLTRFLDWGMREYPAEHYMVVIWGHGQGWTASPDDRSTGLRHQGFGGLLFDHATGGYLDIPTLSGVLASVGNDTLEGQKIDIYAADACLMQMAEVATEIADYADYIVGSTQIQNFLGLPYRRFLYELNSGNFNGKGRQIHSDNEVYLTAMMLPSLLKSSLKAGGLQSKMAPEGKEALTMNTIASRNLLGDFLPTLKKLPSAIKKYVAEDPLRLPALRSTLKETPGVVGGAKDLYAFLNLIRAAITDDRQFAENSNNLSRATRELLDVLDVSQSRLLETVVNKQLGERYETLDMRKLGLQGFSAWLPSTQAELTARLEDFKKSKFYQIVNVNEWSELLKTLAR